MNFFRHSKTEKMNCQQNCIIRNTERSPVGIVKMISGANPYIHKGMKSPKMVNMWVNMKYGCVNAESLSPVHQLFVIPGLCSPSGSCILGISWQEHWSWLPFPSPGAFPHPDIKPMPPASPPLAGKFFTIPFHLGSPNMKGTIS